MIEAPADTAGLPGLHPRHGLAAWAAMIIVAGVYLAWAGHATWEVIETWGTPACSWPLQVRGTASPAQAGLIRCYLRALAGDDRAGLLAVAAEIPPVRLTKADLRYSADARTGLATATVTPSPVDDTFYGVTIIYADGATENTSMMNMIAMGAASGWRMNIGTQMNSGPDNAPPPAEPRPSS